jgi:hypothetical protein
MDDVDLETFHCVVEGVIQGVGGGGGGILYFINDLLGNIAPTSSDYLTQKRCGDIHCCRKYYSIIVYKEIFICDIISLCQSSLSPVTFEFNDLFSLNVNITCRPLL